MNEPTFIGLSTTKGRLQTTIQCLVISVHPLSYIFDAKGQIFGPYRHTIVATSSWRQFGDKCAVEYLGFQ